MTHKDFVVLADAIAQILFDVKDEHDVYQHGARRACQSIVDSVEGRELLFKRSRFDNRVAKKFKLLNS